MTPPAWLLVAAAVLAVAAGWCANAQAVPALTGNRSAPRASVAPGLGAGGRMLRVAVVSTLMGHLPAGVAAGRDRLAVEGASAAMTVRNAGPRANTLV